MEEAKSLKLYGVRRSPFAMRVELALKLKGIPYEYVEEDLQNKSQELLRYNPIYKKVPVLVHDGRPIAESLIILEYIDDTWKEHPLHRQNPYLRAKARFWANFLDQKLLKTVGIILRSDGEEQETAMKELSENLQILEEGIEKDFSGGSPFFHGERPGLLDTIVACSFYFNQAIDEAIGIQLIGPQKNPLLFKWVDSLKDLPELKEIAPPHDKLVAHMRQVREKAHKFSGQN